MMKHLVMAAALMPTGAVDARAAELGEAGSPLSLAETVSNFVKAAKNAGATVFATVDHAEGARSASAKLPETTLIIFGIPKIGPQIIAADRRETDAFTRAGRGTAARNQERGRWSAGGKHSCSEIQ